MVSAMIGEAMAPVLKSQAELRERIIGIDSNGTGRSPGALQRQDAKLQQLDEGQIHIIEQLGVLTTRSETWSKAKFYKSLPIWIAIILSLIGSVIGYLTYRAHTGREITQGPHAQVMRYDAGN